MWNIKPEYEEIPRARAAAVGVIGLPGERRGEVITALLRSRSTHAFACRHFFLAMFNAFGI